MLPKETRVIKNGKLYILIATSDGKNYSTKLPGKFWSHTTVRACSVYSPPDFYKPHHLKNLRLGCKLFLEEKFYSRFQAND